MVIYKKVIKIQKFVEVLFATTVFVEVLFVATAFIEMLFLLSTISSHVITELSIILPTYLPNL